MTFKVGFPERKHSGRKHSKFSASGAERWFNCPGSVELSEGLPDKDTVWSIEGTKAHEVLEKLLIHSKRNGWASVGRRLPNFGEWIPKDMLTHGISAANFILRLGVARSKAEVQFETRVHLKFIHPQMFGTFDGAVIEHFGTLDVIDYKYGQTAVSPKKNLQMIFYAIGLAALYDWNFKRARLWIVQPRLKGYDGPVFWDLPIQKLKKYVGKFERAVDRVKTNPDLFVEGSWCHWCKAKSKCPLKQQGRLEKAVAVFAKTPITKRK